MGTFIQFIVKNLHFILFLILEVVSINLAVNFDNRRKSLFLSTSNQFSGFFQENIQQISDYLHLGDENRNLVSENARLQEEILNLRQNILRARSRDSVEIATTDSLPHRYSVISASVISNSFSSVQNYLTINVGSRQGVHEGMGVISEKGPVGIVIKSSHDFSKVLSIYNIETAISALVKKSHALGVIQWEPFSLKHVIMREIPRHIELTVGDTVVTSGYSFSFPPDIPLGTVEDFNLESGENDYTVKVKLIEDLYSLSNCYVINDTWREEIRNTHPKDTK